MISLEPPCEIVLSRSDAAVLRAVFAICSLNSVRIIEEVEQFAQAFELSEHKILDPDNLSALKQRGLVDFAIIERRIFYCLPYSKKLSK